MRFRAITRFIAPVFTQLKRHLHSYNAGRVRSAHLTSLDPTPCTGDGFSDDCRHANRCSGGVGQPRPELRPKVKICWARHPVLETTKHDQLGADVRSQPEPTRFDTD